MTDHIKRWFGSGGAARLVLFTWVTIFIAWISMIPVSVFLYGGGSSQWLLLPILLGMTELVAAPFVTAMALALNFAKVNTASSLVIVHAVLLLVFVLMGAGVLGKDNDLGELAWLPIGIHALLVMCIAWIGSPNPASMHAGV